MTLVSEMTPNRFAYSVRIWLDHHNLRETLEFVHELNASLVDRNAKFYFVVQPELKDDTDGV